MSLLRGAAFLSEGKLDRVIEVAEPAEKDSLTRSLAHQLKLAAFEQQGKTVEADALLDTLVRGDSEDRTRQAFLLLGLVDAGMGIVAVADADIDRLERAAERFIALDKQCARIGLPDAVKSALDLYHYTFSDDVGPAQRPLGIRGDTAAKAKHAMKSRIEGLDEEAKLTLREGLEEFAEAVRLLAIEDPFDAWDEVARLVGSDWPEGLSAEEAVRQIRE